MKRCSANLQSLHNKLKVIENKWVGTTLKTVAFIAVSHVTMKFGTVSARPAGVAVADRDRSGRDPV